MNKLCAVLQRFNISTHKNSDLSKTKKKEALLRLSTIIVHNFHNSRQLSS